MDTVRLGMTDLQVSPICFGTWQLGGVAAAALRLTDVDPGEIDAITDGTVAAGGPTPESV
jgi:aryl-alcohol dehydrogenase-like predicted oxidoreductase